MKATRIIAALVISTFSLTSYGNDATDLYEIETWDKLTAEGTAMGEMPEADLEEAPSLTYVDAREELVGLEPQMWAQTVGAGCSSVHVKVVKSSQKLSATCDGRTVLNSVATSTAKKGKSTPSGTYRVYSRSWMAYSNTYDNAPMARALFWKSCGPTKPNCYAVHATVQKYYKYLGRPASNGCIRLTMKNAVILWNAASGAGVTVTVI